MFLQNVFTRIGGSTGDSSEALKILINQLILENIYRQIDASFPAIPAAVVDIQEPPDLTARIAELAKKVEEIKVELAMLADPSALLAETRKTYAVDSGLVHLAGVETISGTKTFSATLTAAKFQTATTSVSAPSATPTTIFTIPNGAVSMYLVSANIGSVGDAANYSAFAIIAADGATARIVSGTNAPLQTITLSGLNVQSTQSSGATRAINLTATKIG